jgi:hypothetical protein
MPDVQSPTGLTQACPVAGTFTGVVNGAGGKPYVCSRDVAITGVVTVVNGPFILYVLPTTALSGAKQEHSLDLRTAVINASGSASNVQIYKSGAAALSLDTSVTPGQVTFSGLLYAPQSALDLQASKWWTGSVIVKAVNVTGAPVLTLGYDLDLQRLVNDWAVTHYAEVPASEVGL